MSTRGAPPACAGAVVPSARERITTIFALSIQREEKDSQFDDLRELVPDLDLKAASK